MPRVFMTESVSEHIKRREDYFGMYAFSGVVILLGIVFIFLGAGAIGFPFLIIGILAWLFVRYFVKREKRYYRHY